MSSCWDVLCGSRFECLICKETKDFLGTLSFLQIVAVKDEGGRHSVEHGRTANISLFQENPAIPSLGCFVSLSTYGWTQKDSYQGFEDRLTQTNLISTRRESWIEKELYCTKNGIRLKRGGPPDGQGLGCHVSWSCPQRKVKEQCNCST